MRRKDGRLTKAAAPLIFAVMIVVLTGCQTAIDPGAFKQFTESTVDLREETDAVLVMQYEWARERFLDGMAVEDSLSEENVQKLLLENVPGQPFAWTTPQPPLLFLEARRFQETVRALNDALVQYAELLTELAAAGRMDEEEFRATAEGINSGLRDAAATLGDSDHNRGIAIFSVGATELFQQYLDSQNRARLREALDGNQENIRALAGHLSEAMRMASRQAFAEYSPRSLDLAGLLTPDSGLGPDQKKDRAAELIELNDLLIKRLETLHRLEDSYRALPGANRELAESLDRGESGLASINRIRDNARRLRDLYRELEPDAGSDADKE